MLFTIITPSFNQLDYLKRCVASVRDQVAPGCEQRSEIGDQRSKALSSLRGVGPSGPEADICSLSSESGPVVHVHHHVQDGGSADGTVDWLRQYDAEIKGQMTENSGQSAEVCGKDGSSLLVDGGGENPNNKQSSTYQLTFASEADEGMYDAINRGVRWTLGLQRTEGGSQMAKAPSNDQSATINSRDSVVAWLNCDEQYLPGTLQKVAAFFDTHPKVDFIYGNTLLLDPDGTLLTYRKNPPLRKAYVQSDHLYVQSASMFFRERVFQSGLRFNTDWKAVSDCDFVLQLLDQGFRPGRMNDYLSIFTMTGENLSAASTGWDELERWRRSMPAGIRSLSRLLRAFRYLEKWMLGGYREHFPLEYEIYLGGNLNVRRPVHASHGSSRFVSWGRKK